MLISPNYSLLPCIYNAHRNISQAAEGTDEYRCGQHNVFKRNYPFQRSYLNTSLTDKDTNICNIANKVEPLKKNLMGLLIDIYA
jgi:hypothetical protein